LPKIVSRSERSIRMIARSGPRLVVGYALVSLAAACLRHSIYLGRPRDPIRLVSSSRVSGKLSVASQVAANIARIWCDEASSLSRASFKRSPTSFSSLGSQPSQRNRASQSGRFLPIRWAAKRNSPQRPMFWLQASNNGSNLDRVGASSGWTKFSVRRLRSVQVIASHGQSSRPGWAWNNA